LAGTCPAQLRRYPHVCAAFLKSESSERLSGGLAPPSPPAYAMFHNTLIGRHLIPVKAKRERPLPITWLLAPPWRASKTAATSFLPMGYKKYVAPRVISGTFPSDEPPVQLLPSKIPPRPRHNGRLAGA
jgi:hypothetical protein